MPYKPNRESSKAAAARKHYANVIDGRRAARKEKTQKSLDKYQAMISARRKYGDLLRTQSEAANRKREADAERERKKANSVWSNIAMLGTSVGSMFGPVGAAIGGLAGAGLGMGISAARGGNPFDFGAQLAGLDPSMAAKAAMSVGKSMGYGTGQARTSPTPGFTDELNRRESAFNRMSGTQDYQLQLGNTANLGDLSRSGSSLAGGAFANQSQALQNNMGTPSPFGVADMLDVKLPKRR